MTPTRVYDELVDFIAAGSTPSEVAALTASEESKERVAELIRREKSGELSGDEASELQHFLELEHIMRLAKARARQRLNGE